MTFASNVTKVNIEVEPGRSITRKTEYLSESQSKKAHIARFRYVAFAVLRDVCVKHITGVDRLGEVLINADGNECPLP
jgi:hypothetical protein